MQTRRLGRTGHHSSLAILGGVVFHFVDEQEAGAILDRALDAGVNHLDIAPGYGSAESTVGPHIPAVRDRLFITEKSGKPTQDEVRRQLERTLTRLGIDSVDVYQLHGVTDIDDLNRREGAVTALQQARAEGLCRWIGITGHNVTTPVAQLEAVRRYDLDTVMFPIYPRLWADQDYRRDAEALLAEAQARDLGVMVIKAAAARPWVVEGEQRSATTWYEPQADPALVARGVRFALSTPGVTAFCTPGDGRVLPWALDAAADYVPMTDEERASAMSADADDALIFPIPV
ncbi:MAG TPA: aldo/keto reductase [Mycobacteriales bacterium]|nr:aldo/keto reductase [Mycobacteriales bacterium]